MKTTVKEKLLGTALAGVIVAVGCVPMIANSGAMGKGMSLTTASVTVSDQQTEKPTPTASTKPIATESAAPGTDKPVATEPAATGTDKPTATESATPGTDKPAATEPATGTDKPATTEPATPGTDKPTATEPAAPGTDKPATTEPAAPGTDKPATPGTDKPAVTETAVPTTQAPIKVDENDIVPSDQIVAKVVETMKEIAENILEITTDAAPVLDKTVFDAMLENGKDMFIAVVNERNEKIYAWNFKKQSLEDTDINVDLTVMISDDVNAVPEVSELEETMKLEKVLAVSCSYKGKLPGAAVLQTYVGDKYSDGETLYLYKYASAASAASVSTAVKAADEKEIAIVNKAGVVVKDGYVDFKISEGADYFLSPTLAESVKEEPVQEVLWTYADINKDGVINLEDAQMALCAALGIGDFTSVQIASIDIDGNQTVNLDDAKKILEVALAIVKLEDVLPK